MRRLQSSPNANPGSTDSAEVQLAAAVLLRALADAGSRNTDHPAGGNGGLEEAEALSFLTEPGGEWAASRRFWCTMAGIDANAFHEAFTRASEPAQQP